MKMSEIISIIEKAKNAGEFDSVKDQLVDMNKFVGDCGITASEVLLERISEKDLNMVVGAVETTIIAKMAGEGNFEMLAFAAMESKTVALYTISIVLATIGVLMDGEVL